MWERKPWIVHQLKYQQIKGKVFISRVTAVSILSSQIEKQGGDETCGKHGRVPTFLNMLLS